MAETKTTMNEEKHTHTAKTEENKHNHATHEHKEGEKQDEKAHDHKHDSKTEHKHEEKKEKIEVKKVKKDHAIARNEGVHISKRHGIYICSFIKGKTIDRAIKELEEVIILKRAIPFKGEIPHRKGDMMSGRYPVAASKIFISMLKNLKGAVLYNGMDITKARISSAYTNFSPRPQRRGGAKGKRASVTIEAREIGVKK
ncbi:MAG: hypothetical protein AABX10_04685 [Nanoarchaeota archaeon]